MLTVLEKKDLEKHIDWAYNLALNLAHSAYPTYADGIKTKQDFIDAALKSFDSENEEILLFSKGKQVLGWIGYYVLQSDRYIGLQAFNTKSQTKAALKEFENYLKARFKGFTLYMGFADKNTEAISYFKENNYGLLEVSHPNVFHFTSFKPTQCNDKIIEITKENYHLFGELHRQNDEEMYWDTERILNNLDGWQIYYYAEGKSKGAIYFKRLPRLSKKTDEIFGVDFSDSVYNQQVFENLLSKCLNICFLDKVEHLYYFSENPENEILENLGFKSLGEYNLYTLCLT